MTKSVNDLNIEIPAEIIKELLTDAEWRMVKQRFFIIQLLKRRLSIRDISSRAKVGTDTVVRIIRKVEGSKNLKRLLEEKPKEQSASKWVFGSTDREE